MYCRFVDDTMSAVQKLNVDDFDTHLNSPNGHIPFTIERYRHTEIQFLDQINFVETDGTISTSVYKKETYLDRYLHF